LDVDCAIARTAGYEGYSQTLLARRNL